MHAEPVEWHGRSIHTMVEGSGPPLVLCHGTPFSAAVWAPIADELSSTHTVFRWDMPGYGRSSRHPDHAVDLDTQARTLAWLVDEHWGLSAPVVVAHDIGGAVSLRAHLVHRVEMQRLVLVDAVCLQPWGSPFYRLAQDHAEVFAQLPAAMHRAVLHEYLAGPTHHELDPETLSSLAAPWLGAEGQAAFYRQIEQVHREHTDDLPARFAEMRCPAHVVWGIEDTWLPLAVGRRLAEALGTEAIEIAEAGHLVQYDQPHALTGALRALLT